MEPIVNPHDRFFRHVFSQQETAADFLRSYLPPDIAELLDFSTLELAKDSFVDDELRQHFSDLLYQVQRFDAQPTYVYVLFEHKSYPEILISLQLLRYMTQIWDLAVRQKSRFIPILPIVVYHGRTEWRLPRNFAGLFDLPQPMGEFFPDFHYWLVDLSSMEDADIKGEVLAQVAMLTLKHIFQNDLDASVRAMTPLLVELARQKTGLQFLETWLRYLAQGTNKIDEQTLKDVVEEVSSIGGVTMPTLAEIWTERGYQQGLQQGMQQGLQQGMQQGLLQGREEGVRDSLLASIEILLEIRFGIDGLRLMPEIRKIHDTDVLRAVQNSVKAAQIPADVRRIYTN